MGILVFSHLAASMLGFLLVDEMIASLHLWVGEWVLTVICAYAPMDSSD